MLFDTFILLLYGKIVKNEIPGEARSTGYKKNPSQNTGGGLVLQGEESEM